MVLWYRRYGVAVRTTCSTNCTFRWTGQPGQWQAFQGFASTRKLLERYGWLTVKQLEFFQTTLVHKTLLSKRPLYLHSRFCSYHTYTTRQHITGCIRLDQNFRRKSDLPRNSFRQRGAYDSNALTADIRTSKTLQTFKSKFKRWIKMNIESY